MSPAYQGKGTSTYHIQKYLQRKYSVLQKFLLELPDSDSLKLNLNAPVKSYYTDTTITNWYNTLTSYSVERTGMRIPTNSHSYTDNNTKFRA